MLCVSAPEVPSNTHTLHLAPSKFTTIKQKRVNHSVITNQVRGSERQALTVAQTDHRLTCNQLKPCYRTKLNRNYKAAHGVLNTFARKQVLWVILTLYPDNL